MAVEHPRSYSGEEVEPPNVVWTVVATLILGVLGVVVAAVQASSADRRDLPQRPYWVAFAISLVGSVLLQAVALLALSAWVFSGTGFGWVKSVVLYTAVMAGAVAFGWWADTPLDREQAARRTTTSSGA